MVKKQTTPTQSKTLRTRVEEFLNSNLAVIKKIPAKDVRNLFEDLQIYQAELETHSKELQKVNDKLRASEYKFRHFLDNLGDIAYETDDAGIITYGNKTGAKLVGLPLKDIIGKPFLPFIAEESRALAIDVYQRTLKGESPEYILTLAVGAICRFKNRPLRDKRGKIVGVFGIARDITGHKFAEDALKRSEREYRLLADNVLDVICVIDLDDLAISYISPSVERAFGYTPGDVLGRTATTLLTPDSKTHIQDVLLREIEKEQYQKAEPQRLEVKILHHDGSTSWAEVTARFLRDGNGQVISVLCAIRDVSKRKKAENELKESQEWFRTLFALSPSPTVISILDSGEVILINDNFTRVAGYTLQDFVGRTSVEAGLWLTPEDRATITRKLKRDGSLHNVEIQFRNKQGEVRVGRMSSAIINVQGRQYMLSAIDDITEKKQLEDKLAQSHHILEEKVRERTLELEEKNTALKVLLDQRDDDRKNVEKMIVSNIQELLMPNFNRLKNSGLTGKQQSLVNILESNLNEIISPFADNIASTHFKLTPMEVQVANFIKNGATSKEIAIALNLSQRTVDTHRYNIRKKLDIRGKGLNLRTYLSSLV